MTAAKKTAMTYWSPIQLNALAAAAAAACNNTDNYGEHVVDEHCSMASVTIELRQQLIALIELSAVSK